MELCLVFLFLLPFLDLFPFEKFPWIGLITFAFLFPFLYWYIGSYRKIIFIRLFWRLVSIVLLFFLLLRKDGLLHGQKVFLFISWLLSGKYLRYFLFRVLEMERIWSSGLISFSPILHSFLWYHFEEFRFDDGILYFNNYVLRSICCYILEEVEIKIFCKTRKNDILHMSSKRTRVKTPLKNPHCKWGFFFVDLARWLYDSFL